ncbi:MAG: hypothetical protein ACYDBJ_04195 [Aggregatilineales bacterium]
MRRSWLILLLAGGLMGSISACQTQSPIVTATPVPTVKPTDNGALPPTWTPGPLPTAVTPTDTPPVTIQPALGAAALSALPPTWTPAPVVTDTPLPIITLTDDPYSLTLTAFIPPTVPSALPTLPLDLPTQPGTAQPPALPVNITLPADCAKFQTDTSRTTRALILHVAATIAWYKIPEADHYQLWILAPDDVFHYTTSTGGDNLTVPPGEFPLGGLYGWELVAFSNNTPICQHLTGVFVVRD